MIAVLDDLRAQVEILRWCKEQHAKIKELEDQAKAAVQDAMGDADTGILDGEIAIAWGSYKRNAFDQKAFKALHPEMFEEFKSSTPYRRFDIV